MAFKEEILEFLTTGKEMIFILLAFVLALLLAPGGRSTDLKHLDYDVLDLSLRVMQLAAELYLSDEPSIPGGIVYVDEPDAAIFLQEDKYCFAIFRGTTQKVADWVQNLDPFNSEVCSTKGQCCKTLRGFQRAYSLPDYKDSLEDNLRQCKNQCPECEVVLAGHSQGGAIATVAAIVMDDLDPTIIVCGQPGTIVGDCSAINVDKYYRYVNTLLDFQGGLEYDPVPYLNFGTDHLGHLFVMGDDDKSVVYYKDGSGPSMFDFGWNIPAHDVAKYIDRLNSLRGNAPLKMEGWRIGFACSVDEECVPPQHCINHKCYEGINGDPCKNNEDCDSRRCAGIMPSVFTGSCMPRLESGKTCTSSSVCKSGQCRWFKCA